ncbi:MAG: hypothetical protein ACK2T3_10410 [Candidatus Promineifilaceae bacterium]|jgi:hypothetical protein
MIDIPNILEFLEFFDFLRGPMAGYILLITASTIFILRDWRWSVLALLVQYLVVGLLFSDVLEPQLAFMKVVVGLFICVMLYITARQVHWGKLPIDVTAEEAVQLREERLLRLGPYTLPTDTPFRIFFALMVILVVWTLSQRPIFQLPIVPDDFNLAVFALVGLGLVNLSFTSEPLKAGMGLLTFFTGFELFYSGLEQSVLMLAFLAAANLAIALVISYLTQARHDYEALVE